MLSVSVFLNLGHGAVVVFMTGAGAVSKFRNGVVGVWVFPFFVRVVLIVVSMASGAIGLVGWSRPIDDLRVALVALVTIWTARVIAWICCGGMVKIDGAPTINLVALVALNAGYEMVAWFSLRCDSVVAGRTRSQYRVVIDIDCGPAKSYVAVVTLFRGENMIPGLAWRGAAIMTGDAVTRRAVMVKNCRQPCVA